MHDMQFNLAKQSNSTTSGCKITNKSRNYVKYMSIKEKAKTASVLFSSQIHDIKNKKIVEKRLYICQKHDVKTTKKEMKKDKNLSTFLTYNIDFFYYIEIFASYS